MLERMNIELMRTRVHGADSSLTFLQEDDNHFDRLSEFLSWFVVTRQRDVGTGEYINKLTIKLISATQKADFEKADALDLRLKTHVFRYVIESKDKTPISDESFIAYAQLRGTFNEITAVEDPV